MRTAKAAPLTNLVAEKHLLGGLLKSETAFWQVSNLLRPDHFSNSIHQQIYGAVRDICTEGKRLSLALVSSRLPEEDDGGKSMPAYLAVLLANSEDGGSPLDYVDAVVETWARRRLIDMAKAIENEALSGNKPAADVIADAAIKISDVSQGSEVQPAKDLKEILQRVVVGAGAAYKDEKFVVGFDTGLASIDEICGRFMPGNLIFVGASQGDGKSAIAAQIAMRAAQRANVLFFQLEMQDEEIARRMLAAETGLSVSEIEEGQFDFAAFDKMVTAQRKLEQSRLFIDDRSRLKLGQIRARSLAFKNSSGLGMVIVDHLRLVQADGKVRDQFERTEYVTGGLKSLAKELKVPIVCLAQRTRTSQDREDPMPRISDFFGGGSIEQDADVILGLWRRDMWLRQREPRHSDEKAHSAWIKDIENCRDIIEGIGLKRRRGSPLERCRLRWEGRATRLAEINT